MRTNSKEQIIEYILTLIDRGESSLVSKVVLGFGISKSAVYNYLKELVAEGDVFKEGAKYYIMGEVYRFEYGREDKLREERVLSESLEPIIRDLPKNVFSIWRYAFLEMLNNAIEHSEADSITVTVSKNRLKTSVLIQDNGIGIFQNIKSYKERVDNEHLTLEECASLLFAGRFTTAREHHSGEGIFFTSNLMDDFVILSDGISFTRNNFEKEKIRELGEVGVGTAVFMTLYNHSKKTTLEVFNRFSTIDEGFIKTSIPIAHFFPGGCPISRSEARRLGELIVKFEEIELDFSGVEEIGQGFTHELFVVWQKANPTKKLNVLSATDSVDFMIRRVINTKYN